VKESLLNLLVFLLAFVAAAVFFLATYGVAMVLVPGGRGLVFSNPFAAALMPSLLAALVVTQFRSIRRPGRFAVTWSLVAGAFLLLLALPIPLIQQMPSLRAADASPLVADRFLTLADGSLILSSGTATVLVPAGAGPMDVSDRAQYDTLNHRFVFSAGEPRELGSTGPERAYFQYPPALASLETDLLALFSTLRTSADTNPGLSWLQAWSMAWLFLGLWVVYSIRTWPLVHVVLVLVLGRLALFFLVYAYWSVPALAQLWLAGPGAAFVATWAPVLLVDSVAASLFFMTWLTKPHRREGLL